MSDHQIPQGQELPQPPNYLKANAAGKRELIAGAFLLFFSIFTAYAVIYTGLALGYCIGFWGMAITSLLYLWRKLRPTPMGIYIMVCTFALNLLQAYNHSSGLSFLCFCAQIFAWQYALQLMTQTGRYGTGGICTVFDAGETFFIRPFEALALNLKGLSIKEDASGNTKRKTGAVILGLFIAIPLLAILIPLLMRSDAAFEGLMDKLLKENTPTLLGAIILGSLLTVARYSKILNLRRMEKPAEQNPTKTGFLSSGTVTTIYVVISLCYGLYLFSQLAYFVGGFAGILPEGFTPAEYARRGFFEMSGICAINLVLIALGVILVKKDSGKLPLPVKILCSFICLFSLVLVAASVSKMYLYITCFGLTPKRIYTMAFMVFLSISMVAVALWLWQPRVPYMKPIICSALAILLVLGYVDVGTLVARYNVTAYQTGVLQEIDVRTVSEAGPGATPYLISLLEDKDPEVVYKARCYLYDKLSGDAFYDDGKPIYTQQEDDTFALPKTDFWGWSYQEALERTALEELLNSPNGKLVTSLWTDKP